MRFKIHAETEGGVPTLYIFDQIGKDATGRGTSISDVQEFIDRNRSAPVIRVQISSTGGDIWTGLAIYEALMRFPGKVHTFGSGIVASAASIIFLAGSTRELAENTEFMIHQAWVEVAGGVSELANAGRSLDQVNSSMVAIIVQRTGQDKAVVKQWIDAETWFSAHDAKTFGFATLVSSAVQTMASHDVSRFVNTPLKLKQQALKRFADAIRPKPRLSPEAMVKKYGKPKNMAELMAVTNGRKS